MNEITDQPSLAKAGVLPSPPAEEPTSPPIAPLSSTSDRPTPLVKKDSQVIGARTEITNDAEIDASTIESEKAEEGSAGVTNASDNRMGRKESAAVAVRKLRNAVKAWIARRRERKIWA